MRSARLFLPLTISLFMKRVSVRDPKRGSGGTSRLTTRARLGIFSPFLRSRVHAFARSKLGPERENATTRERANAIRTSLFQAVQRTAASSAAFVKVPGWLKSLLPAGTQARYVSAPKVKNFRQAAARIRLPGGS